ncbi:hypothetical protein EON65_21360 [archaeon]|nr:MAG: hypothetical protein EON65_21360 [archaeon]
MSTRAKRTAGGEEKPTSTTPSKRGRGAKDTEGYLLFKEEEKSKNKKEKVSDIKSRWEGMSEDMKKVSTSYTLKVVNDTS